MYFAAHNVPSQAVEKMTMVPWPVIGLSIENGGIEEEVPDICGVGRHRGASTIT